MADETSAAGGRPAPVLVARDAELARLNALLDQALAGRGQVCYIAGEAGTGKTALSEAFQRLAQARHPELLIAAGSCDAQGGADTPYAPFREVLTSLTASTSGKAVAARAKHENEVRLLKAIRLVTEAVAKFGPDLVGVFLPGTPFLARLGDFVLDQIGLRDKLKKHITTKAGAREALSATTLTQDQMIEQFVNVLRDIAIRLPLVIVLDDLHWADAASIDLLFRLVRRISDVRLLLIAAYRPLSTTDERQQALERVVRETQRNRGEVVLDLGAVVDARGRQFVDAFLETEPNHLSPAFREELYKHTEGNPLFTIELLRDLQQRGLLERDASGAWCESKALDWSIIPARVEGVIAARLAGLPADLRDILNCAAVEGEVFTAEIIAERLRVEPLSLIRTLSGALQTEHKLVRGDDARRIGNRRASRYRFTHQLVQRYLYDNLDRVERSYLHEAVGLSLEQLHASESDAIAPVLARHFEAAGLDDKARLYLLRAGQQAAGAYANEAALAFFDRLLALCDDGLKAERRDALLARERVLEVLGRRSAQREDLEALDRIARVPEDATLRDEVRLRSTQLSVQTGDYAAAITTAAAVTTPERRADALLLAARAHFRLGEREACHAALDQALELSRRQGQGATEARALQQLALLSWSSGDLADAEAGMAAALARARSVADLRGEAQILVDAGVIASDQHHFDTAERYFTEARAIVKQTGQRAAEARILINEGGSAFEDGDLELARDYAARALEIAIDTGERQLQAIAGCNLAEAQVALGGYAEAGRVLDAARAQAQEIGYRRGLVLLSEVAALRSLAMGDAAAACQHASEALPGALGLGLSPVAARLEVLVARACLASGDVVAGRQALARAQAQLPPADAARSGLAALELGFAHAAGEAPDPQLLGAAVAVLDEPRAPLWVHAIVLRCASAAGDPRAREIARSALAALDRRAVRIRGAEARAAFTRVPPEHAEVQAAWASLRAEGAGQPGTSVGPK